AEVAEQAEVDAALARHLEAARAVEVEVRGDGERRRRARPRARREDAHAVGGDADRALDVAARDVHEGLLAGAVALPAVAERAEVGEVERGVAVEPERPGRAGDAEAAVEARHHPRARQPQAREDLAQLDVRQIRLGLELDLRAE